MVNDNSRRTRKSSHIENICSYSKRVPIITVVTALLCSSVVLGATVIDAHERPQTVYPAGYAADHVDASTAITQHHRAVVASGSVHTTLTYEATANGGASVRAIEGWTNFTRGAQLLSAEAIYAVGERYVEDGVQYTNTSVSYGDRPSYDRTRGDLFVNRSTGREVLRTFLPHPNFALQTTATVDGQRLLTYEAIDFDADSFSIYMRTVVEVSSFDARLVVDERGRIHEFTFTLDAVGDDGNPLTVEVSLEFDGFGDTNVERPDWVDDEFE